MMPISKPVLIEEIEFSIRLLERWKASLEEGIPEEELPATEGAMDSYFYGMCGELALISDKLATLARLLSGSSGV